MLEEISSEVFCLDPGNDLQKQFFLPLIHQSLRLYKLCHIHKQKTDLNTKLYLMKSYC